MGSKNSRREQLPHILSSFYLLLLLLLLQIIKPGDGLHAASQDILVLGASLTGNQTRISRGGIFQFGFFNLNNNVKDNWYLGIWYAEASQQTIVWVANVEQPLHNASSVLNLKEDGSLLLSYGSSTV